MEARSRPHMVTVLPAENVLKQETWPALGRGTGTHPPQTAWHARVVDVYIVPEQDRSSQCMPTQRDENTITHEILRTNQLVHVLTVGTQVFESGSTCTSPLNDAGKLTILIA